jgi:hypothetical protein
MMHHLNFADTKKLETEICNGAVLKVFVLLTQWRTFCTEVGTNDTAMLFCV